MSDLRDHLMIEASPQVYPSRCLVSVSDGRGRTLATFDPPYFLDVGKRYSPLISVERGVEIWQIGDDNRLLAEARRVEHAVP